VLNAKSGDCKELLDSLTSLNAQAQAVRLQLKAKVNLAHGQYPRASRRAGRLWHQIDRIRAGEEDPL